MTMNVLLADDHAIVRDGLRMILESRLGIHVVGAASNGREAVQMAESLHPDVAIIDIAMPEMNGIEATRHISESSLPTQVIILSMYSTAEHVYRAMQAGALGYVLKESAGDEVIDAMQSVNNGKPYLSKKLDQSMIEDYIIHRQAQSPLESLSSREREVLQWMVEGKNSAEIAEILELSGKTIETYRSRLMSKLRLRDMPSLVKFALQYGLTSIK